MIMNCPKKDECVNYKIRCFNCQSVADVINPYPKYVDKAEHERRLLWLLNGIPELLNKAGNSPYDKKHLVTYLVNNGVRVEE